jgi:hypothetical protein
VAWTTGVLGSLSHHPHLGHADVVTVQQEFISACNLGPAGLDVTELGLGRQYSTLRVQLFSDALVRGASKRILPIEALIRQGNLRGESANNSGITLPTVSYTAQYGELPPRTECSDW